LPTAGFGDAALPPVRPARSLRNRASRFACALAMGHLMAAAGRFRFIRKWYGGMSRIGVALPADKAVIPIFLPFTAMVDRMETDLSGLAGEVSR